MNIKKSKYFVTGISLLAGLAILTTGVVANYKSAMGYDDYKRGLISLIKTDNVTTELNVEFSVDGKVVQNAYNKTLMDRNGDVKYNSISSEGNSDRNLSKTYVQDGKTYYSFSNHPDAYEFMVSESEWGGSFLGLGRDRFDEKTLDRGIRFGELLSDMFIGDLKNNVILVSSDNGENKYTINLDRAQIPEIVNAGLGLLASATTGNMRNNYDENYINGLAEEDVFNMNPFLLFENEQYVKNATCDVTIDGNGNLAYNKYNVVFAGTDRKGNSHEMLFTIELKAYDYGTTTPERLDDSTVKIYDPRAESVKLKAVEENTARALNSVKVEVIEDKKIEFAEPEESVETDIDTDINIDMDAE